MFPYIARLYVQSRETFQQLSEQTVKYILVAVLPAVLCLSILAERIVLLLFSQQYVAAAPILRVLAWLLIPQFLNPFLSRVLYARGYQRQCLAAGVIALLIVFGDRVLFNSEIWPAGNCLDGRLFLVRCFGMLHPVCHGRGPAVASWWGFSSGKPLRRSCCV